VSLAGDFLKGGIRTATSMSSPTTKSRRACGWLLFPDESTKSFKTETGGAHPSQIVRGRPAKAMGIAIQLHENLLRSLTGLSGNSNIKNRNFKLCYLIDLRQKVANIDRHPVSSSLTF